MMHLLLQGTYMHIMSLHTYMYAWLGGVGISFMCMYAAVCIAVFFVCFCVWSRGAGLLFLSDDEKLLIKCTLLSDHELCVTCLCDVLITCIDKLVVAQSTHVHQVHAWFCPPVMMSKQHSVTRTCVSTDRDCRCLQYCYSLQAFVSWHNCATDWCLLLCLC